MKALFTALINKFTGSTLATALTSRFYNTIAPQDAAMPYCVFTLVSGTPDDPMGGEHIENCLIQFSLFDASSSPGTVCDNYEKLTALFDDCALSLTGYTHLYMHRESQQLMRDPEDPGVWHYVIEYRILIEKA